MKVCVTCKGHPFFGDILEVVPSDPPHTEQCWFIIGGDKGIGKDILKSDCVEVDCPTCGNTDAEGLCAKGKTFCSTPEYQAWKPIVQADEKACPEKKDNRCNIDGHVCVDNSLCNMPKNADGESAIPIPVAGQLKISSAEDKKTIYELQTCLSDRLGDIAELRKQVAQWKDNENGQNILRSKYRRILISLGLTDDIDVQIIRPDCNTNTPDAIAKKYFIDKMIADKEEIRKQLEDHYYKQIRYLQDTLATAKADNEALRKQYNDRDYHLNSCQEGMAALRENYDAVNKGLEEYRKKHNKNMAEIENLHKVISKLGEQL